MNDDARTEWLLAAYVALEGIPSDLLAEGAKVALQKADHPSKIIPAIIGEIGETWEQRKNRARGHEYQALNAPAEPRADPNYCTPEEAAAIVNQFKIGEKAGKARDPSRPTEQAGATGAPGRKPTRADYINVFGMTPEQCDAAGIR